MQHRLTWLAIIITFIPVAAWAQEVVEPEKCILDTLKGATSQSPNTTMIGWNCVRQYVKALEPNAMTLSLNDFTNARAQWFPTMPALPTPIQEHIIITVKNDSLNRVIAAEIALVDTKTKKQEVYKAYVDYPIEPGTVGSFQSTVITGATGAVEQAFWKTHDWGFKAIWGVTQ